MNTSGVWGAFELPGSVAETLGEGSFNEVELGGEEGSLRRDLE